MLSRKVLEMKRILMAIMLVMASQAQAADKGNAREQAGSAQAAWEAECGSCHLAYPARFLTAETWKRLMANLGKHFGDNASLDQHVTKQITEYLVRNASSKGNRSAASMRISDTSWFVREHHEVNSKAWSNPAVKSPANCTACHINASRGDWSERGIRMPAGLGREGDDDDDDDDD